MSADAVLKLVADKVEVDPAEWADRELCESCLRRDERAWREFMRRFDGSLRGVVYKRLRRSEKRLPNDFKDDVMGDFYVRLTSNDLGPLRSFDWSKGSAFFSWLAFLATQCAVDYLRAALNQPVFVALTEALEVPDEGGVLMGGYGGPRGSLSAKVRQRRRRAAVKAAKQRRRGISEE
jgi:DNA-directed RNA polymerase specialized sigma24 family protein